MDDNSLKFIEFARTLTPQPVEKRQGANDDRWVLWGIDNIYPNFLLKLFGEVPLHQSITTSKVDYLMGDGLVIKGQETKADFEISILDSLEELVQKLVFDYVLFNFFAVEVQYNVLNKPFRFNHVPAQYVRCNRSRTKFWVSEDWQLRTEVLSFDRWCPGRNEDGKTKLFFYSGYTPTVNNVYPDVKYKAGIVSMVTDMLVNDFNKNNLEDGFNPAHIISFFRGNPSPTEAREFEKKFADRYSGTSGLKYIINYNNPDTQKSVQIDTVDSGDFAEKLVELNKKVETNILTAHQVTSPLLFGIKTDGQLGGATEIETSYEMFKNLWVKNNRNIVESGLNKMFMDAGFPQIEFKDKTSLFTATLSPVTREKVLTIDELRAIDGRPPLPDGQGEKLLLLTTKTNENDATNSSNTDTFDDENDLYKNGRTLKDEDFEHVKHLGKAKSDYHVLNAQNFKKKALINFDEDDDIENYLMKTDLNGKTLDEISDDIANDLNINISADDLRDKIESLTEAGIIESDVDDDGTVNSISPVDETNDDNRTIEVMYDYQVKPGYGATLIKTSRSFCKKLIDNDRLYTRDEIQTMSEIFGYDVFTHCGGWYNNPDTGEAEDQCRHQWVMQRVIRKVSA